MAMTKRERVERTMNLQETDRVPIYDLLRCDAAFAYFGNEKLPPLANDSATVKRLNDIAGRAVDRFLDMTRSVGFGYVADEEVTDELGVAWRHDPQQKTQWIVRRPFEDVDGAVEFVKQWMHKLRKETKERTLRPEPVREAWHTRFMEVQKRIGDTVNLLGCFNTGLDRIRRILGFELFAYVQADEPELVSEFMDAFTANQIALCHAIADLRLSPAVLTFGDIACKGKLMHSPAFLRREFFPRLKRINDAWHEHGFKCLFHSDGYLMDIMDDLIATGIDGLNPIETIAGMDLKEVKEKYGTKIFLAGGIDMSQLLAFGSVEEVRETCTQAIDTAYPGYFLGSTTELDNSSKLENIIALHEVAMGTAN